MKGKKSKRKVSSKKQTHNIDLQSKQNSKSAQVDECDVSSPANHKDYRANSVPPTLIERLNKYSNLFLGFATICLVIINCIYIYLTWKVATETQRLADISVEQFKIRAFPTFLVVRKDPTYRDGKYSDKIEVWNKGEISSHETSFLLIYAKLTSKSSQPRQLSFFSDWPYVYRDQESGDLEMLDYSVSILPNSKRIIGIERQLSDLTINKMKFQILFVRHKVPYDTKYSYEAYSFALEAKKGEIGSSEALFHWEPLPENRQNSLIGSLFDSEVFVSNRKKVIEFFKDYPASNTLKFQVREFNIPKGDQM